MAPKGRKEKKRSEIEEGRYWNESPPSTPERDSVSFNFATPEAHVSRSELECGTVKKRIYEHASTGKVLKKSKPIVFEEEEELADEDDLVQEFKTVTRSIRESEVKDLVIKWYSFQVNKKDVGVAICGNYFL